MGVRHEVGEPAVGQREPSVGGSSEGEPGLSLREMLAGYDDEVRRSLAEASAATTGLDRVRALHNRVRPSVVAHDAVLRGALCPLLDELPEGHTVAETLRRGCEERADLLERFDAVSRGVAAHNVYPVSATEVENVLEGLDRSFAAHARDETVEVSDLLERSGDHATARDVIAAMEFHARRAPTRHPVRDHRHRSAPMTALRRWWDRVEDWTDSHGNWSEPDGSDRSPRPDLVRALHDTASAPDPSVPEVLEGFDAAVTRIIRDYQAAPAGSPAASVAARRAVAAIAVHDSVIGGVLCPLLEHTPAGARVSASMRKGCERRAELQWRWAARAGGARGRPDPGRSDGHPDGGEPFDDLIEAFDVHQHEGTTEVESILGELPDDAFRTKTSPLNDAMWPWRSGGPALLALRMALWASVSPTRTHAAMLRHPSSHAVRRYFRAVDHYRDRWKDGTLRRWMSPTRPSRPFSHQPRPPA